MNKPKGGRGVRTPYESTHVRVPVPIKDLVEKVVQDYKDLVLTDNIPSDRAVRKLYHQKTLDQAVRAARLILKRRGSLKYSLEKLLTAIYNEDVLL